MQEICTNITWLSLQRVDIRDNRGGENHDLKSANKSLFFKSLLNLVMGGKTVLEKRKTNTQFNYWHHG
uniref:Uncharacterized protein n=1 Tax=Arion vulgaris TaxID=1028688 RepID=A0A0B7BMR1_9EUPU